MIFQFFLSYHSFSVLPFFLLFFLSFVLTFLISFYLALFISIFPFFSLFLSFVFISFLSFFVHFFLFFVLSFLCLSSLFSLTLLPFHNNVANEVSVTSFNTQTFISTVNDMTIQNSSGITKFNLFYMWIVNKLDRIGTTLITFFLSFFLQADIPDQ